MRKTVWVNRTLGSPVGQDVDEAIHHRLRRSEIRSRVGCRGSIGGFELAEERYAEAAVVVSVGMTGDNVRAAYLSATGPVAAVAPFVGAAELVDDDVVADVAPALVSR